jgi:hypothetical protein
MQPWIKILVRLCRLINSTILDQFFFVNFLGRCFGIKGVKNLPASARQSPEPVTAKRPNAIALPSRLSSPSYSIDRMGKKGAM